jgi:hypothetical protein
MHALRRGGVKPRSPKGAPTAQGLRVPPRRKTIVDAVNREATCVSPSVMLPLRRVWHTVGDPAGWGGWARAVHAPPYVHETESTHLTIFIYPTYVSGGG